MDASVNPGSNGRGEKGYFAKGNRLAKGNPNNKRMYEIRRMFLDAVDTEAVAMAARRLCAMAQLGDLDAIKILLDYAIGKPPASLELSGPEGEPLDVNIGKVQAVIIKALAPYPEARVRVAAALMELSNADDNREPGDGD